MNAGEQDIARFIANAAKLEAAHAYSPEQEHDACRRRAGRRHRRQAAA